MKRVIYLLVHHIYIFIHVFQYVLQTDTASVLMEAIGYIKFLQGQVEVYISHIFIDKAVFKDVCKDVRDGIHLKFLTVNCI